ncbi:MAG: lipopolysaccharide biosynthesis protein [Gammaproteobacteria bacterium]
MNRERLKKVFRSGLWVLSADVFRQALAFVLMVAMARLLTKESVGEYQLINAAVFLANIFTLEGLNNAVVQSVARGNLGVFRKAAGAQFGLSVLGGVGLVLYGLFGVDQGSTDLRNGLFIVGVLFPLANGLTGWIAYQAGREEFKKNALYQSAVRLISYGVSIIALLVFDVTIVELVLISSATLSVANSFLVVRILLQVPKGARIEKGVMRYGLRASVYDLFNVMGRQADKFLLFYFLSAEAVAVYAIAERLPELMKTVTKSLRTVLIPDFSRRTVYTDDLDKQIGRVVAVLSVIIVVIVFLVIPWFVPLVFSQAYEESVFYCQLLFGTMIIGQMATLRYGFILSRFDSVGYRNVTVGTNLVRLVASAALVPFLGIMGAVLSTAVYRVSTSLFVWHHLKKFYRGGNE